MTTIIHRNDIVKKYSNDELSIMQQWALDSSEKNDSIRLTKIFLALNGASGCNVREIPPNLAGFFSYFVNSRVYEPMQRWRSRVQNYQRHLVSSQNMFQRIENDFAGINVFWDRMVCDHNIIVNNNPNAMTHTEAVKRFQRMEIVTKDNFGNFNGASWSEYYIYVSDEFDSLIANCEAKGDAYRQSWLQWFGNMFNPVSWFNFACHGLQTHSNTALQYENFNNINISKKNILFNRNEDIRVAQDAMNDLNNWITQERIALSNQNNRIANSTNMQNTQMFKAECDRLMSIIRDRIGRITQSNPIESNPLSI
jgi:hypothetical protein